MRAMAAAVSRTGPARAAGDADRRHCAFPPMHCPDAAVKSRTARSPRAQRPQTATRWKRPPQNPNARAVLIASARVQLLDVTARQASSSDSLTSRRPQSALQPASCICVAPRRNSADRCCEQQ